MFDRQGPALGILEVDGYVAMAAAVEAMTKASDAKFLGFQRTGGYTMTGLVSGEIASVEHALKAATSAAAEASTAVKTSVLMQVDPEMDRMLVETMGVEPVDVTRDR